MQTLGVPVDLNAETLRPMHKRAQDIPGDSRSGFSLVELVIVVVIIGVIAAIAIPALSGAQQRAMETRVRASAIEIQSAMERYAGEHNGMYPVQQPDGSITTDRWLVIDRLTKRTDEAGDIDDSALFGPYLRTFPKNPFTTCEWLRIGGDDKLRSDCSWHVSETRFTVRPDHTVGSAQGSHDHAP